MRHPMKTAIACVLVATAGVLAAVGCGGTDEEPVYGLGTNEPAPDACKDNSKKIKLPEILKMAKRKKTGT